MVEGVGKKVGYHERVYGELNRLEEEKRVRDFMEQQKKKMKGNLKNDKH